MTMRMQAPGEDTCQRQRHGAEEAELAGSGIAVDGEQ